MRLIFSWFALAAIFLSLTTIHAQQVLLIPDSDADTVGTYNPFDGSQLDADFIVSAGEMVTPLNAIDSGNQTIFLSDQGADAVFEYGFDGTFLGVVLDEDNNGIDNICGITMNNGNLLASIGQGAFADTIQRFDLMGGQSTVISGVGPFDVFVRNDDILVSNVSGTGQVESYDINGVQNFEFDSDISFPEQITEAPNGDIVVGGFIAPSGVYRYDAAGTQIGFWDVGTSVRGVYVLGNGNILYTSSTGVFSLDPNTGLSTTIVTSGSYRFIELIELDAGNRVCTTASAFDVFRGNQLTGTLADSFDSDDSFLSFNPGFTISNVEAPVWLIFDGSIADTPSSLDIVVESNAGTPGLTITTEAFDFVANDYDVVDERNESFDTDTTATINITAGIGNFVDTNGNVRTRIGWRRTGFTINFPWEVRLDQAVWKSN